MLGSCYIGDNSSVSQDKVSILCLDKDCVRFSYSCLALVFFLFGEYINSPRSSIQDNTFHSKTYYLLWYQSLKKKLKTSLLFRCFCKNRKNNTSFSKSLCLDIFDTQNIHSNHQQISRHQQWQSTLQQPTSNTKQYYDRLWI